MNIKPGDTFNFLICEDYPYNAKCVAKSGKKYSVWKAKFRCKCGIIFDTECKGVKSGKIKSCGCFRKYNKNIKKNNGRTFLKEELEECIKNKLTYKQIAQKFNCSIALVSIRVNEYKLEICHNLQKLVNTKNNNGKLTVKKIVKNKGNYQLLCQCKCGKEITMRPTDFKNNQIKSCGCLKPRVNGKLNKTVLSKIRIKAKNRNIEFSITLDYLIKILDLQQHKCVYSKQDITFPKNCKDSNFTASLDRIDSSKGYIEGNVQWVTKRVNSMKNDMTEKEFIELCKLISNNN